VDGPAESPSDPIQSHEPEQLRAEVPLLFSVPVGMTSRYAHQLMLQGAENEVVLSFFEVIPPMLTGTPDEQRAILLKGVRAECVARISVARARFPEFVRAMQELLTASIKEETQGSKKTSK
jgi:hypothetical protein